MSSPNAAQPPQSPPPVPPSPPQTASGSGVRRYHTISNHGRTARGANRTTISEETVDPATSVEDEYIDPSEEWIAPVGAVGEKNASLHRQASLPTKYHTNKDYRSGSRQPGSTTPLRTLNSLSAIHAEHGIDGEGEEDWETEMRGLRHAEEAKIGAVQQIQTVEIANRTPSSSSPLSPSFVPANAPSPPPPSGAGVRRHQSLTYGANHSSNTGLKRSGTLAGLKPRRNNTIGLGTDAAPGSDAVNQPSEADGQFVEENYDDDTSEYQQVISLQQQQQQQSQQPQTPNLYGSPGSRSPWGSADWKTSAVVNPHSLYNQIPTGVNGGIDDVQRALSALELSSGASPKESSHLLLSNVPGQAPPPRFNNQNIRGSVGSGFRSPDLNQIQQQQQQQTATNQAFQAVFASLGFGSQTNQGLSNSQNSRLQNLVGNRLNLGNESSSSFNDRLQNSSNMWEQPKERTLTHRTSNSNIQYQGQLWNNNNNGGQSAIPPVPSIPSQSLLQQQQQPQQQQQQQQSQQQQQQQAPRLAGISNFNNNGLNSPSNNNNGPTAANKLLSAYNVSPIDVPTLIAMKGYNPTTFEIRPNYARYFVIKSFTEDDVHKSLKYEIWSSTDPGNKRLDKAFKECNGRGPVYLFFSVNASGHFCGMAEMLTSVDYTRSSTVWASDKWKGVFKVRWVFVRDIPNANLRHIRLNNTQERKPVTNSRDTQELLPEAGQEMLRIFFTHPARTSLLQDFAYYELQSLQKLATGPQQPASPGPPQGQSQNPQSPQLGFSNSNVGLYGINLQAPMPQGPYLQSVMRNVNASPAPSGSYSLGGNLSGNY